MSVDTNVNGKNLAAYRTLRHDGLRILVTPQIIGMAESMRVVATGVFGRKLSVQFQATPTAGGDAPCC